MQKDSDHVAGGKPEGAVASQLNGSLAQQVSAQCHAVACMAAALARIHQDYVSMFQEGHGVFLLGGVGKRSAELMELFGDILNNMDAVTDEDDWMAPVFAKAQELWPKKDASQSGIKNLAPPAK